MNESNKRVERMKDRKSERKRDISFLLNDIYYRGCETFLYAF